MDSQGMCWSSGAPPAVHLSITCPKVTLRLRSYPSSCSLSRLHPVAGSSSLRSQVICQLSMHELQLAGKTQDAACRSLEPRGTPQKTCLQTVLNASIARLHLSKGAPIAAAADGPPGPEAPACLATSPAVFKTDAQGQVWKPCSYASEICELFSNTSAISQKPLSTK